MGRRGDGEEAGVAEEAGMGEERVWWLDGGTASRSTLLAVTRLSLACFSLPPRLTVSPHIFFLLASWGAVRAVAG